MDVVILCGGSGTRLREETEFKPKVMVNVGPYPIIWHIMKLYSHYGHSRFILPLGYKGNMVKQYFCTLHEESADFELDIRSKERKYHNHGHAQDWKVAFVDTGLDSGTAERLKRIKPFIKSEQFLLTYGDGVAPVDIPALIAQHNRTGAVVTVTGVNPLTKYGILETDGSGLATAMREKPVLEESLINGGFMICNREVFDYIDGADPSAMLVNTVLPSLAKQRKLGVFVHRGFWHCMDTYKDYLTLNKLWEDGAPWAIWK